MVLEGAGGWLEGAYGGWLEGDGGCWEVLEGAWKVLGVGWRSGWRVVGALCREKRSN